MLGWTEKPEFCCCAGHCGSTVVDSAAAAAGLQWICGGLLLAVVRCQHFLGSPVQLQGRDSADVPGEFRFPPHKRALSTLIFLDLDTWETVGQRGIRNIQH